MADHDRSEVSKLRDHLSLLSKEYAKLQIKHDELERKYSVIRASVGQDEDNSFVVRLLKAVADLFDNPSYSDLKICLQDRTMHAHKFVLRTRSQNWGTQNFNENEFLDWTGMDTDVGVHVLRWIYTDQVELSENQSLVEKMITVAHQFGLPELVLKCENCLITALTKFNCLKLYSIADSTGAKTLKEHCSKLISSHWASFTKDDFSNLSAAGLYEMLKLKSQFPLHDAIRFEREDVVFLVLLDSTMSKKLMNDFDSRGSIPLDLALQTKQISIAKTLVQQGADLNARDSNGYAILHNAILRGDEYTAEFLLDTGAAPESITPTTGETPLHLVCRDDNLIATLKKLLLLGANPNSRNTDGKCPLHGCVESESQAVLEILLEQNKLDLEAKTKDGHTALWLALLKSNPQNLGLEKINIPQLLIKAGASPNAICSSNGNSLLHMCAEDQMESAAIFLCQSGANVKYSNLVGETPLHLACRRGLTNLAQELIASGAELGATTNSQDTPLHCSLRMGHQSCAQVILASCTSQQLEKSCIEAKDSQGLTPLGIALKANYFEVAASLVAAGADVNAVDSNKRPLLNRLILEAETDAVLFLLEHGADINARKDQSESESPLFLALDSNNDVIVEALCKKGVDSGITNQDGDCVIWIAIEKGLENVASILVRYGVDTDFWSEGPDGSYQTLLHRAIDQNMEDIGIFLIRTGCDVNSPRKLGPDATPGEGSVDKATPLHLAATWGLAGIVGALLEHRAEVNAKDDEGKTAIHLAVQNHYNSIVDLLLMHEDIDLTIKDRKGFSPFATAMICKNNVAAKAILKRYPTAAEQHDTKGRNFLHLAIENKDIESVLFLLSINVDVNSRTKDSRQLSPIHLAVGSQSEILVRNILLAGANVNEKTPQKLSSLHISASSGNEIITSILLDSGVQFDAVDNELHNALHIAVKEGNYQVCKVLLTESRIDAEAVNLKGQTPIHCLAKFGKEAAAAIFNLFLECMPDYPINKADVDGNTPLLLAYMAGNGELCRALAKAKASLGAMNRDGITIFNYQVPTRQLLYRVLDLVPEEPIWTEGDICLECGTKFSITIRKHHCRHCGRLLCSKCSDKEIPIVKFGLNRPVRVCSTCFEVLALGTAIT